MMRAQARPVENLAGRNRSSSPFDFVLVSVALFLLLAGLVMVASSSITMADKLHANPLYYFWRQLISVVLGLGGGPAGSRFVPWGSCAPTFQSSHINFF